MLVRYNALNEAKGKHLTKYDRREIARLRAKGESFAKIAARLGKVKSTVSYELKKNSRSKKSRYGQPGVYDPDVAQQKASVRRKYAKYVGMKIVQDKPLRSFIDRQLLKFQAPEAISGRLKLGIEKDETSRVLPYVSRSAIEKYLGSVHGEIIRVELDRFKKRYRRRRKKRPIDKRLAGRVFIDERPAEIEKRERIGDLEMDFVVSGKGGSGCLLTAVDRKSRLGFIRKIQPVSVENLKVALLDIKLHFPELLSITADNDILLACHNELSTLLEVPFYFCHPYSSWEKGSIENLNRFIRKFIRKGTDISSYKNNLIAEVEGLANGRFMGVLGYLTPLEVLGEFRESLRS